LIVGCSDFFQIKHGEACVFEGAAYPKTIGLSGRTGLENKGNQQ
jgi:hypothetical protein